MPGLLLPGQYGASAASYQDEESPCSSRQGLVRSQRSSTVSGKRAVVAGVVENPIPLRELNPDCGRRRDYGSTTAEERTALKSTIEETNREAITTIRLSRTRMLLIAVITISLLVLSSIFTAIGIRVLSATTCTSISCVTAAETLRRKSAAAAVRNNSSPISPCGDFYEYACAGWAENTIRRTRRGTEWNVAHETSFHSFDEIGNLFKALLATPTSVSNLTSPQAATLATYQKCITDSVEDSLAALQMTYNNMHGWLSTAHSNLPIETVLVGAYRTNAMSLFVINAQLDAKDVQARNVLTIEEAVPYLGIVQVFYTGLDSFEVNDLLSGRLDHHWVNSILFDAGLQLGRELGIPIDARFNRSLAEAILLDYKITRCSPQFFNQKHGKPEQWRTTMGDLEAYDDWFDFRYFIKEYLGQDLPASTEIVVAPGREYFERMMAVLKEYSTSEGRSIIRDYIKFKQLFMLCLHSGKLRHTKHIGGLVALSIVYSTDSDTNLHCINRVAMVNTLGFASILERFWAPQLRENMKLAAKIGEAMKREYVAALRKSDVIDDVDRVAMIEKAERVRVRVAVPEAARDEQVLLEESQMFINDSMYPWSIFFTTAMGNRHWMQMSKYGKKINQDEWPTDTNTFNSNVHYNFESNSILFPIIWSRHQYLDARLPSFFSYAGFGSIVGHEITHGFDHKGRNFGPSGVDGNLTVGRTAKNIEAKQQCFHEQYAKLGEKRIAADVMSENFADNVGLALIHRVWKAQDEMGKKLLPGIELNSEQAFFTAYAQNWCSLSAGAEGSHSPGKLRVNGPLQNSAAFSEAFSCPAGSFMNPAKKCSTW